MFCLQEARNPLNFNLENFLGRGRLGQPFPTPGIFDKIEHKMKLVGLIENPLLRVKETLSTCRMGTCSEGSGNSGRLAEGSLSTADRSARIMTRYYDNR